MHNVPAYLQGFVILLKGYIMYLWNTVAVLLVYNRRRVGPYIFREEKVWFGSTWPNGNQFSSDH